MLSLQGCAAVVAGLTATTMVLAQPPAEMELPSCVRGSPPLRLPVAAERATLDSADRQRFQQAAEARYPLYQRGGQVPNQVLMLRRGGHWQYVTLWQAGPHGTCFTAVFAADRFDFTAAWLDRYKPRGAEPED